MGAEWWQIHPSMRGRKEPLRSDREHDWMEDSDHPEGWVCDRCGRPWISPTEPAPTAGGACPGMQQSTPDPVSDDREERREKHGQYGPLCDYVRGMPCAVEGCTDPSDPCHVRPVGKMYGDWIEVDGEEVGNVANLCRYHHEWFDGRIPGKGARGSFVAATGCDPAAVARRRGEEFRRRGEQAA